MGIVAKNLLKSLHVNRKVREFGNVDTVHNSFRNASRDCFSKSIFRRRKNVFDAFYIFLKKIVQISPSVYI